MSISGLCWVVLLANLFQACPNEAVRCSFISSPPNAPYQVRPRLRQSPFSAHRSHGVPVLRRAFFQPAVCIPVLPGMAKIGRTPEDGENGRRLETSSPAPDKDLEREEGEDEDYAPAERPISVVVSFLAATRLTPGPNLPAVGNDFEYLLVSEDREGEEWTLGSAWVLPSTPVGPEEELEAAVARVISQVGLDEESTVLYPDFFMSPIFEVGEGGQGEEAGGILQYAMKQRVQAEALVICHKKSLAIRSEARRWYNTQDISKGWMEATGGKMTLESGCVDGTFYIGDDRVSEEVVGVLARAEGVRELLSMAVLTEPVRAREQFVLLAALAPSALRLLLEEVEGPEGSEGEEGSGEVVEGGEGNGGEEEGGEGGAGGDGGGDDGGGDGDGGDGGDE